MRELHARLASEQTQSQDRGGFLLEVLDERDDERRLSEERP
jgi:hypothetical protein